MCASPVRTGQYFADIAFGSRLSTVLFCCLIAVAENISVHTFLRLQLVGSGMLLHNMHWCSAVKCTDDQCTS
jgi:hypothetical protein